MAKDGIETFHSVSQKQLAFQKVYKMKNKIIFINLFIYHKKNDI